MRVALVGDSHFDEHSRFEECVAVHDFIAEDVARRNVDILVHSGDVFERKSTPAERRAVASWLAKVARHCPVVIVRGNHDALGDLAIFSRLRTARPVIVEEAAAVHRVETASGPIAVACLAWPRKAEVIAATGATGQEGEALAQQAIRNVLRGLGLELAATRGPRMLLAHAMVTGSLTSTGQPLIGHDMELGLDDLEHANAHVYALGHIHKGQAWEIGMAPVIYPGSPRRTAFGEVEPKGYQLIEIGSVGNARSELIPTPCAPMLLLEGEYYDEHIGLPGDVIVPAGLAFHGGPPTDVDGAEIRFRYRCESDRRDAARAAAGQIRDRLLSAGAVAVKVEEEVIATARARIPEIARATTISAKLDALWAARGVELGERKTRVIERLHQVEQEERAA